MKVGGSSLPWSKLCWWPRCSSNKARGVTKNRRRMHGTCKFLPHQDNLMNGAWSVTSPPPAPFDSVFDVLLVTQQDVFCLRDIIIYKIFKNISNT